MALDRQSIEKKDFPIGRRGYDPEAVDAHLASVAAEIERLRTESRRRSDSMASQASEQVRMIVEAAEQSAAEITRQAEAEAGEIRGEADTEAQSVRRQASEQAREHVAKVNESSSGMLERVDAMETELTTLIENLRTGANRLNADLALLEGSMSELRQSTGAHTGFAVDSDSAPDSDIAADSDSAADSDFDEPADVDDPLPVESDLPVAESSEPAVATDLVDDELAALTSEAEAEAGAGIGDDAEGARLVALNMALNGTPRDETDRYLAERYALSDRDALLDEVYATVGE